MGDLTVGIKFAKYFLNLFWRIERNERHRLSCAVNDCVSSSLLALSPET